MAWKEHGSTTPHKDSAELQVEKSENKQKCNTGFLRNITPICFKVKLYNIWNSGLKGCNQGCTVYSSAETTCIICAAGV